MVGQDRAKKVLSVAVYNHYKRIYYSPRPVPDSNQKQEQGGVVPVDQRNVMYQQFVMRGLLCSVGSYSSLKSIVVREVHEKSVVEFQSGVGKVH